MKSRKRICHPQKGEKLTVEPIRKLSDIKAISKMLIEKPRDHLLIAMGVNNGLRVIDLLNQKSKDACLLKQGSLLNIKETKTGKK